MKNQNQRLVLNEDADPGLVSAGILFRDVYHLGCSQKSREEADEVRKLYTSLLTQRWIDKDGLERPICKDEVVVVSPYNMQVNLLQEVLPRDARVGTVDKFQGQEAAVVLISMVGVRPGVRPTRPKALIFILRDAAERATEHENVGTNADVAD